VNSVTGIIATVAGNGTSGYGGDGLVATNASVELDGLPASLSMLLAISTSPTPPTSASAGLML